MSCQWNSKKLALAMTFPNTVIDPVTSASPDLDKDLQTNPKPIAKLPLFGNVKYPFSSRPPK
jgi:hypothetical protein